MHFLFVFKHTLLSTSLQRGSFIFSVVFSVQVRQSAEERATASASLLELLGGGQSPPSFPWQRLRGAIRKKQLLEYYNQKTSRSPHLKRKVILKHLFCSSSVFSGIVCSLFAFPPFAVWMVMGSVTEKYPSLKYPSRMFGMFFRFSVFSGISYLHAQKA